MPIGSNTEWGNFGSLRWTRCYWSIDLRSTVVIFQDEQAHCNSFACSSMAWELEIIQRYRLSSSTQIRNDIEIYVYLFYISYNTRCRKAISVETLVAEMQAMWDGCRGSLNFHFITFTRGKIYARRMITLHRVPIGSRARLHNVLR